MVNDGMMDRFNIGRVFGMHNLPGLSVGEFATRRGAIMAATDTFDIVITGKGGHAAMPHNTVDPLVTGAQIVSALQTIVSRNTDPLKSLVISVTKFQAGDAYNVIAQTAKLSGTYRTLDKDIRDYARLRIEEMAKSVAQGFGAEVTCTFMPGYPVTFNHEGDTEFTVDVAGKVAGPSKVNDKTEPVMGGEDFSYMLEARPGSFMFMGNGDTAYLHHPNYDFNDEAIPHGISYWVALAETALAPSGH
jgi:hippurate hydrolase